GGRRSLRLAEVPHRWPGGSLFLFPLQIVVECAIPGVRQLPTVPWVAGPALGWPACWVRHHRAPAHDDPAGQSGAEPSGTSAPSSLALTTTSPVGMADACVPRTQHAEPPPATTPSASRGRTNRSAYSAQPSPGGRGAAFGARRQAPAHRTAPAAVRIL